MRILSADKKTALNDLKRPSVYPVAALFVLSAITGCGLKDAQVWETDKPMVLESVQQAEQQNAEMKTRVEMLEQRILELETTVKRQGADNAALTATIKSLNNTLSYGMFSSLAKHPVPSTTLSPKSHRY